MKTLRAWVVRLGYWLTRKRDEERLAAELEEHLALQTAENVSTGMDEVEARRQAALKLGSVVAIRESYWDQKGWPWGESLLQDVRLAFRRLVSAPGFALTSIAILGLGIGAVTSIFTLAYAVLFRSLAVAQPAELVKLGKAASCCYTGVYSQSPETSLVSYNLYRYFQSHAMGFAELAAFSASVDFYGVRRGDRPDAAQIQVGELVSGNYFEMFGTHAYAGRLLRSADDRPGAIPVAVMSYRLWQAKYGGDLKVIGSVFDLNQKPYTIVGIAPPDFYGDTLRSGPPDLYLPFAVLGYGKNSVLSEVGTAWLDLIGRLRPGYRPEPVQAEMRVQLRHWLNSHAGEMTSNERATIPQQTLNLTPGGAGITQMRDEYEHWLRILMLVTGFVLLIVCGNVANLTLLRGLERRRQTAVSIALGARPWALVRQALIESMLLSVMGGLLALLVAYAGTSMILQTVFPATGDWGEIPIAASPSIPVLAFAFAISMLTGIAFGVGPAVMAIRTDAMEALRGASRSTARGSSLPRKLLVVLQAALALVLLSASGLLTAALHKIETQDFGFDQDRRIIIRFDASLAGYEPARVPALYRRIQESFGNLRGVETTTLCTYSPLSGDNWGWNISIDGHPAPGPNDDASSSMDRVVPGYFAAISNPVVRGRPIEERDTDNAQHVAVINEAFARKFFPRENPIGKHFGVEANGSPRRFLVVGVARDARYETFDLDKPPAPMFFIPEAQHELSAKGGELDAGSHYLRNIIVVERKGETVSIADLKKALAAVDPNLPITWIHTLREQVKGVFRPQRLIARLTSIFGVVALVLSSIGLYGLTAYNVGRRTAEIGIRIALGAQRGDAIALIMRGAFGLVATGLLIGLPLSVVAGRLLQSQLTGVGSFNSLVMSIATGSLAGCGLLAAAIPAWRASLILPWKALRTE
ncbi:MAG: ABC transporter permease [Acidobacteriaceae bacterium]|nr:ABC transporter permease [Acidobacteriaceae bacterium]